MSNLEWVAIGIGINLGANDTYPPHSYVFSTRVPDANNISLNTVITALANHAHKFLPRRTQIVQGMWNMWVTPCFERVTQASTYPWLYMSTFTVLTLPSWWNRSLPQVTRGMDGYKWAISAARERDPSANLPDGTPLYSLYFLWEVRDSF
jgi:hypothetical protein